MFDAMQAPPFGLEQRLINRPARVLDDPWRSVGRVDPYPVTPGQVYDFPPYALFLSLPNDLKTQRVHSWNAGVQHQLGDNMACRRHLPGQPHGEPVGRRHRQSGPPASRPGLANQPVHAEDAWSTRRGPDLPELLDRAARCASRTDAGGSGDRAVHRLP